MRRKRMVAALAVLTLGALNVFVWKSGSARVTTLDEAPSADAIVVLGAGLFPSGAPSHVLHDRLDTALQLYRAGRAPRILVTGDHGRATYDEPRAMREWLEARGVPAHAIFMDHAGFDTYSSMARARRVFLVRRPIVVTQGFHLPRALYLAQAAGMQAAGVPSDARVYSGIAMMHAREVLSRPKAWLDVLVGREPRFLGPAIPIDGDGRVTHGDAG
jgi:SanA protein